MKKFLIIFILASLIISPNFAFAKTYLLVDKNYYEDGSIGKGFLDEKMVDHVKPDLWQRLLQSREKGLIDFDNNDTFNQYYLKNWISPEDNYQVWNPNSEVGILKNGTKLNVTSRADLTYVWPSQGWDAITLKNFYSDQIGLCEGFWNCLLWVTTNFPHYYPSFFSRLSVWELDAIPLPKKRTTGKTHMYDYSENDQKLWKYSRDTFVFPKTIGYGEKSTVNDYMLTPDNDFIIPARYNEKRNDVFLTMRWRSDHFGKLTGAQVYITAKDSRDNSNVWWNMSSKYFLTATSNIYINEALFDSLGDNGKRYAPRIYSSLSKSTLTNLGISDFQKKINEGLKQLEQNSGARTVAAGHGWQIQLTWFYRDSEYDETMTIVEEKRKEDSIHLTDIHYFMYSDAIASIPWNAPIASNDQKLYSPNESIFKIETTRPYFSDFGDNSAEIIFDENNFDDKIWEKSFNIQDKWVLKNSWEKISVDKNRVRIRISEDNWQNFSPKIFTFDELKNELQKEENSWKKLTIAYTYAATDANDENIWKLPTEIADNTGAYAVPFVRNIVLPSLVEVKYLDIDDENNPDFENTSEKIFGKNGENFETTKKDFQNYELEKISCFENNTEIDCEQNFSKNNEVISGKFSDSKITIIYQYKKLGKVTVKYVNENGEEISSQEEKSGKIGTEYSVEKKDISGYEFVKLKEWEENGKFEKDEKTVIYEYKKLPETGKIIIKFLDENGQEIAPQEEKTGKIWEKYDVSEKNISDYEFVKIKEWEKAGEFKENEQIIIFEYKKIEKKTKWTVFIKFLDENNNEIFPSKSEIWDIWTAFNFSPENISDYEFVKIFDWDSANGNFTENDQTVRFVYKKIEKNPTNPTPAIPETGKIIVKYVDEAGNEIEFETKEGKIWEEYSISEKNISGYEFVKIQDGDSKTGKFEEKEKIITFIYKKIPENGKIVIKFLDENNKEIAPNQEKTGKIGTDYSAEKLDISGYDFVRVEWKEVGKFEKNPQNIIYFYKKKIISTPSVSTSGAGGYITENPKTPLKPLPETTITPIANENNENIFKTGLIAGQCVSIIKNLDDSRLIAYYTGKLDIAKNRKVHADVSRWEFMKMLFLASGINLDNVKTEKILTMSDVSLENPNFRYIAAGLNHGIIQGQTDGNRRFFRPNDTITRSEAAKIFVRVANLSTSEYKNIFSDLNNSMSLAKYAESAYENCLLHGRKTRDGQPIGGKPRVFEPNSPITVAETAKVLYNMTH